MEDYATSIKLRIDWSETDALGHINNLAIQKYTQTARVHLLEVAGLMQLYEMTKKGPIIASIKCQFRKPLFYPGEVFVYSKVGTIKNTSFEILHTVCNEKSETVAESTDIIVYFDFIKSHKLSIPDDIREKLENHKGSFQRQ